MPCVPVNNWSCRDVVDRVVVVVVVVSVGGGCHETPFTAIY